MVTVPINLTLDPTLSLLDKNFKLGAQPKLTSQIRDLDYNFSSWPLIQDVIYDTSILRQVARLFLIVSGLSILCQTQIGRQKLKRNQSCTCDHHRSSEILCRCSYCCCCFWAFFDISALGEPVKSSYVILTSIQKDSNLNVMIRSAVCGEILILFASSFFFFFLQLTLRFLGLSVTVGTSSQSAILTRISSCFCVHLM